MSEAAHQNRLALTSRWTAGVRARESQRPDHLFNDPLAAALAGSEGLDWAEHRAGENGASTSVIRTRFFDEFLLRTTQQQGIQQVVLIAAGLDTRAYRLAWPAQTQLFELDQPQVLEYKEYILSTVGARPVAGRHPLQVDLTGPWTTALTDAGFDRTQPSVWLSEGLFVYLSSSGVMHLLDTITSLAATSSWLGFDVVNSAVLTSELTREWVKSLEAASVPWTFTMDDPIPVMAARGWVSTLTQPGEENANFGRWLSPVVPPTIPGIPRCWFVCAQKQ